MLPHCIAPNQVSPSNNISTRQAAFVCTRYLAEKEVLRYEIMMQICRKKTVFEWTISGLNLASVVLLEPSTFENYETLPKNCICIWICEADTYLRRKEDLTLPVNFQATDLMNALDRAALKILDMKTARANLNCAYHRSEKSYRISEWVHLEQNFSTIRFQKILALMIKKAISWDWLLIGGNLTEKEAFLFLNELRKRDVLVEQRIELVPTKEVFVESPDRGTSKFAKKMMQWLRKARTNQLKISQ